MCRMILSLNRIMQMQSCLLVQILSVRKMQDMTITHRQLRKTAQIKMKM